MVLGSKSMPPVGKMLIYGSMAKVRVKQVILRHKVQLSLQGIKILNVNKK